MYGLGFNELLKEIEPFWTTYHDLEVDEQSFDHEARILLTESIVDRHPLLVATNPMSTFTTIADSSFIEKLICLSEVSVYENALFSEFSTESM